MARVVLDDDDTDELNVTHTGPGSSSLIKTELCQPNPENPREDEPDVDETGQDMKAHGQLQAINLMSKVAFLHQKPHLADQLTSQPFVVINGCRRLLGARKWGVDELRYERHDDWSAADIDRAVIGENEHRVQLDPIRLGVMLANMVNTYGSERALAKALTKSQAWVNHRIGLTRLGPELQAAISDGRVTFKLGRECVRLAKELHPKLASNELPAEVAESWLITNRIDQAEQLRRWEAGPPFVASSGSDRRAAPTSVEPVNPGDSSVPEPRAQGDSPAPTAPSKVVKDEPVNPGDSLSAAASASAPNSTSNPAPGPPVETSAVEPATEQQVNPGDSPAEAVDDEVGSDPVHPAIEIRVMDRSPATLAAALRERLTDEEIDQLVKVLQS